MTKTFWIILACLTMVGTVYIAAWMSVPPDRRAGVAEPLVTDYIATAATVDSTRLRAMITQLTAAGSRVTGYPGNEAAAAYIRGQFASLGFAVVDSARFWTTDGDPRMTVESFPVVVPIDKGAALILPDTISTNLQEIRLYPLWPNLVRTSTVPPEGLSTPIIYGGIGTPEAFNGQDIDGNIVLLEFNSGQNWLTAASLGASAVVFIEPEETSRGEAERKFLTVPADIPRFWIGRDAGIRLRSMLQDYPEAKRPPPLVRLTARMDWENRAAQNIYALLPGTDPTIAHEVIVIESYYDAMSVVPSLAPGAEQASGMAALLEVARFLKDHPLKRPVLFMASSGHGQGLAGTKAFVSRHLRQPDQALQVALFLALDLSTGSDRLGLMYKGFYYNEIERLLQPWVSPVGRQASAFGEEIGTAFGVDPEKLFVDGINPSKGRTWQTYIPGAIALDNEPVMIAGHPGLALVTVDDARLRIDTPLDTPGRMDLGNLTRQIRTLICLLPNLLNTSGDFVTRDLRDFWATISGRVVTFDASLSILPDKPLPEAIVTAGAFYSSKTLMGVRTIPMVMNDADGRFLFEGLATTRGIGNEQGEVEVVAYRSDPETGAITHAHDRGDQGGGNFKTEIRMFSAHREVTVVVFPCRAMTLYDLVDQRYFMPFQSFSIYNAGTSGKPFIWGFAYPYLGRNEAFMPCTVLFGQPDARLRVTMSSGLAGRQLLLLNASPEDPDGEGFRIDTGLPYIPYQAARDMWTLDDARLRRFAEHGILNQQVNSLHQTAKALLDRAETAQQEKRYDDFVASAKAAWSVEARAYPDILGTVDDSVIGVLFYLALLIPFAYCAERLLFAARGIERRIAGMFGTFVVIFLALQYVHPAFAITLTPLIVLLAFLIIAMAAAVIWIVIMKFESRLSEGKTERMGRHEDDVGRAGATATAGILGIANMRNRPFRTVLTCITLVLLTFSVMSFTSVVRHLRVNEIQYSDEPPPYEGILLRHRTWNNLEEEAYAVFDNEFGAVGPVAARSWYYSAMVGDLSFIDVRHPASNAAFTATALVGLTPAETILRPEFRTCLTAGRWFNEGDADGTVLPVSVAEQLGIDAENFDSTTVTIAGRSMPVIGLVDEELLDRFLDIDGESLTPVDFVQMSERVKDGATIDVEEFEVYIHLPTENVVFLPHSFVMNIGGTLQSIAVGLAETEAVIETLDKLMPRTELTLFAGTGEEVFLYSTVGGTSVGGLGDLFVPILIAALIVMNTMLGSVYERVREIGVFNAVGLAPAHVGALFLAEACVYAVLGVVLGYLSGQSVAHLIIRYGWLPGFELNVSSLAAVGASALVMAVVVLSTLYPARMASRIAVPSADMGWRLPPPEGDRLILPLPFTVTGNHALGINTYLKEFLESHVEVAVGQFSCEDVVLSSAPTDGRHGLSLRFTAWLVPYDLGVSQRVELQTAPTDDAHIFTLDLVLDRLSGDSSSWLRLNRTFLNILRKQFLIWRTLSKDGQTRYVEQGKNLAGGNTPGPPFQALHTS